MNHNENARYCRYVREHGLCMNTLAETEEAYAIEQDLRAEWGRCLNFGCIGRTEPLARKVWDEYFQPELERKLKAIRKPYDQEADVACTESGQCADCGCVCNSPQQVNYQSTLEQRQLEDKVKLLQGCNERQFEMIGNLRRELASKQVEVEGQLVVELTDLRAEVNMLRNTWSPPPTDPPGPFHSVADLELIRELTTELYETNKALTDVDEYCYGLQSSLSERGRELREAQSRLIHATGQLIVGVNGEPVNQSDFDNLVEQLIEAEELYKNLYDGQCIARIQEDLKTAYEVLRDREKDLERYEDRLDNQRAIIEEAQQLVGELANTVHGF